MKALAAVSDPSLPTLLLGALPCTGGSPYVRLNWHLGPKTQVKIRAHWSVFDALWRNFVKVAIACHAHGGSIALEWPRRCSYWDKRCVKLFMNSFDILPYHLDGCEYGLQSKAAHSFGAPIRKPWTFASNVPSFALLCRACSHNATQHARCAGSDTRASEEYTDELVNNIHAAWRQHVTTYDLRARPHDQRQLQQPRHLAPLVTGRGTVTIPG